MILGIDTVTRVGSLAVVDDSKILGKVVIDTELNHSARLVSSVDNLLKDIGVNISEIDKIAVDIGPGSFTGIRVGLSFAMGLAQGGGKQLLGACSLDVLMHQIIAKGVPDGIKFLTPAIDAKKGRYYSAVYSIDGKIIRYPYLTTLEILREESLEERLLFGPEIDGIYPDASVVAMIADKKHIRPIYLNEIEYHI